MDMNVELALFVIAIGVSSGVLFRRGAMTQAEAAALVVGRVVLAVALALTVPQHLNAAFYVALGTHEAARGLQYLLALVLDKHLARREAAKWQPHPQKVETSLEMRLRTLVRAFWQQNSS